MVWSAAVGLACAHAGANNAVQPKQFRELAMGSTI